MEKNDKKSTETKKDLSRVTILFSIIAVTILLIIEFYIMINDSQNYINLAVVAVVMLILVYLLVTAVMQWRDRKASVQEEHYENIFKSEKASYLLLRKYFAEIEERLDKIEKNLELPKEEIISTQKAIAKVTISRNKENTDALMNSNDKLMEKIYNFESTLEQANERLLDRQKMLIENSNKDFILKQQELETAIKDAEIEICKEIIKSLGSMQLQAPVAEKIVVKEEEPEVIAEPEIMVEAEVTSEPEIMVEAEVTSEPDITVSPVSDNPNKMMTPEDIAALLASAAGDTAEKQKMDEPAPEEVKPVPAEEMIPEPDPNRKMTAEEIAALFASV